MTADATAGTDGSRSTKESARGFRGLVRDSAVYASGAIVGKAVGLVLLPILTRTLGPTEFGRFDVLSTLVSAGASIVLAGTETAATRLYSDLGDSDRRRMFSAWWWGTLAVLIPVIAGFLIAGHTISTALFGTNEFATAVGLTGLAIGGTTMQVVGLTALRNHQRPGAFAVVSGGSLLLNGVLVVVLVSLRPSVTSVIAAAAVSVCTGAALVRLIARSHLGGRPDRAIAGRLVRLALPLAPAVLVLWAAEFANRAVLLDRAGADNVAYFSVALRLASIAMLVVLAFQLAWQPSAFSAASRSGGLDRIATDGRRIMALASAAAVALALVTPELVHVLSGAEFAPAVPATGFALLGAIAYAGYHTATMRSALSSRMRDLGLSGSVAAATGVALNAWWSDIWGATGAAAAIAAGQVLGVILALCLARQRAPVPFEWGRILFVATAASAIAVASTLPGSGAPALLRVALAAGFVAVLVREGTIPELVQATLRRRG